MINWPDTKIPPINLWVMANQAPSSTTTTQTHPQKPATIAAQETLKSLYNHRKSH